MTLKLSLVDNDLFSHEAVSDQTVLVSNCLSCAFFHELSAQNFCVATVLNKDAV